jgi:hypothetical protein
MLKRLFNISQKRYLHNFTNNNNHNHYNNNKNNNDKIIKTTLNLINYYLKGVIISSTLGGLYIYKSKYKYYYNLNPLNALFISFFNACIPSFYWPIIVPLKAIECYNIYVKKK